MARNWHDLDQNHRNPPRSQPSLPRPSTSSEAVPDHPPDAPHLFPKPGFPDIASPRGEGSGRRGRGRGRGSKGRGRGGKSKEGSRARGRGRSRVMRRRMEKEGR